MPTLVYQNGLANVFDDNFKLLLQDAFSPCEYFCRGLIAAGQKVTVMHCDVPGDIGDYRLGRWRAGVGPKYKDKKKDPNEPLHAD